MGISQRLLVVLVSKVLINIFTSLENIFIDIPCWISIICSAQYSLIVASFGLFLACRSCEVTVCRIPGFNRQGGILCSQLLIVDFGLAQVLGDREKQKDSQEEGRSSSSPHNCK